ncbi:IclR family transcriptional regulator domain-containing protein [Streptomyces sp. NPDC002324]
MMVLEGNRIRFLDGVEGAQALRVSFRTGLLLPAHATSGGKALLAELPPERLRARYRNSSPGEGDRPLPPGPGPAVRTGPVTARRGAGRRPGMVTTTGEDPGARRIPGPDVDVTKSVGFPGR